MREPGGLRKIVEAIEKLKPRHKWHIKHYGQGNEVGCFGVFVAFFFVAEQFAAAPIDWKARDGFD